MLAHSEPFVVPSCKSYYPELKIVYLFKVIDLTFINKT